MSDWDEKTQPGPAGTIFQQARNTIEHDVSKMIQSLNSKKADMFAEIDRLEQEFAMKQERLLTNLNALETLKMRTEEELGDNSLAEVQNKVTQNLQEGIDKLYLEIGNTPDYGIIINWRIDMEQYIAMTSIEIKKVIVPVALHPAYQRLHYSDGNTNQMADNDYCIEYESPSDVDG